MTSAATSRRPLIVAFKVLYAFMVDVDAGKGRMSYSYMSYHYLTVAADTADDAMAEARTTLAILPDLTVYSAVPAPCGLYAL
jgi:hypothetical protein